MKNLVLIANEHADSVRTVICIPPAGTGPAFFQSWVGAPDRTSDLLVVQLPGRGSTLFAEPVASLPEAARLIALAVLANGRALEHPVVLFGHSMGAWIAYELALFLRSRHEVAMLAVSACPPPGSRISAATGLTDLDDEEFLRTVQKRFGEIPELAAASPKVQGLILPAMRHDLAMCESYGPTATEAVPLACPISSFAGTQDDIVPVADALAWSALTTGRHRGHCFPGGHLYLRDRGAEVLAAVESDATG